MPLQKIRVTGFRLNGQSFDIKSDSLQTEPATVEREPLMGLKDMRGVIEKPKLSMVKVTLIKLDTVRFQQVQDMVGITVAYDMISGRTVTLSNCYSKLGSCNESAGEMEVEFHGNVPSEA